MHHSLLRLLLLATVATGCKVKAPQMTEPFADEFERVDVGAVWNNTGGEYRIVGGKLNIKGAKNHPLWLRQRLPRDVVVEVDVMSKSTDGDLKIELFGDGESFDPDQGSYEATGYVFAFGGWQNTLSIIGRLGEHEGQVKAQRADVKVEPGRTYHWTITRKGGRLDWQIDGKPFLSYDDPTPLAGDKQAFLGINNWETDVYFDNLRIRPAP